MTHRFTQFLLITLFCVAAVSIASIADPAATVKITEDFEKGADRWQPTTPANWQISEDHGGKVYDLFNKAATYQPPFRSPFNFALLKDKRFTSVTLTAKVKTTIKSYGHRDIVVVFGYQDPAHFYYVHFGEKADPHSGQVFIVNNAPRTKISTKETKGIPWKDDTWHTVKVIHAADGTVKVYFDDMENTILEANDKTFAHGQVGIGSFDDTARFDDIVVEGVPFAKI
ncbi:MAG: hypothetical protein ACR2OZ_08955 [Verrucomicrobiales bacterium]